MKYKFLIVDDEKEVRNMIKEIISTKFNCIVTQAKDGYEAICKTEDNIFDVILLDYKMPRASGIEFVNRLRKHVQYKNTPIIIISAHLEPKVVEEFKNLGIKDFLAKPFDTNYLINKIENSIS